MNATWHFAKDEYKHQCPECDGDTVWNDSNHDTAHCVQCGACNDPDHMVDK